MDKDTMILFIILYVIGCAIIYWFQHRNDSKLDISVDDKEVCGKLNDIKCNTSKEFNDKFIFSSKNFLMVNKLFFTDNYFDFDKFQEFVLQISEDKIGPTDTLTTLSLLSLLVEVSSTLNSDFKHQLFFSNRRVLDIKDVKDKIKNKEYSGTVVDFYEILISTIFHLKKYLVV